MSIQTNGMDSWDWEQLFREVEWLLDGAMPADRVARKFGLKRESLIKAYNDRGRPVPRQLWTVTS